MCVPLLDMEGAHGRALYMLVQFYNEHVELCTAHLT
jgi:hypothetical protein